MPVAAKHKHTCPTCGAPYPRGFCRSWQGCGGQDGTPWPSPCLDCAERLKLAHADWLTWSDSSAQHYSLDWFVEQVSTRSTDVWGYWSGWLRGWQQARALTTPPFDEAVHLQTVRER